MEDRELREIRQKATCEKKAGRLQPEINRNRCDGKTTCVDKCPYGVLEMGTLTAEDKSHLSLKGRVKAFVHRGRQVMVVNPDACRACNQCVVVCPENAIKLVAKI